MKHILRILICNLCLITLLLNFAQATEIIQKNPEILEKQFVQIEVSNANAYSISVLRSIANLTTFIQAKYYSLLNWKISNRSVNLEVDNYDRIGQFGRWINDTSDEVCFNTRAKVLVRDAVDTVVFKDSNHCVVESGAWNDPYTTETFTSASDVQIDHLVPLKNAYLSGAYKWDFKARCLYANYLGYDFHLISASGHENMRKGDKAPDKYMPPEESYACTYVRNWLAVKMLWGLTMTMPEAIAIRQIMIDQNCSLAKFRMSDAELNKQRRFAQDNVDLCENIDQSLH